MGILSPESALRIEQVRKNELPMDALTLEELDGLEVVMKTPFGEATPAAPAAPVAPVENPPLEGGLDGKTAPVADPAKPTPKSKQDLYNELNTINQRLNSLPKKLKNDPAFRAQFAKENGLEDVLLLSPIENQIDPTRATDPETIQEMARRLNDLTKEKEDREARLARKEMEDRIFNEVDDFVASSAPELAPKEGSWRTLNARLTQAFELANNDVAKVSSPEFQAELEARGIPLPKDQNFKSLTEIYQLKRELGLSMTDAHAVWKSRNPSAAAAVSATPANPASDRANVLLGNNASAQGGNAGAMSFDERLTRFYQRCGTRMDRLTPQEEAEWAQLQESAPKPR